MGSSTKLSVSPSMQLPDGFWMVALTLSFIFVNVIAVPNRPEIIIKQAQPCDDVGTGEIFFGGTLNYAGNGVHIYHGLFSIKTPMDHNTKVDVEIQQLRNGVYIPKFLTLYVKDCKQLLSLLRIQLIKFFESAGARITECPFPVGEYYMNNYPLDINFPFLPPFFYGQYKAFLVVSKGRRRVGCEILYGEVVPKTI